MKRIKLIDKLFGKLGYIPKFPKLPEKQIKIRAYNRQLITISSVKYEEAIRETALTLGGYAKAQLIDGIERDILTKASKFIEITECENPLEIRGQLLVIKPEDKQEYEKSRI